MDEVLQSHQRVLDIVYGYYSKYDVVVRNGVSQKAKYATFNLDCWMTFLEDCRLIQSARHSAPWGRQLSQVSGATHAHPHPPSLPGDWVPHNDLRPARPLLWPRIRHPKL